MDKTISFIQPSRSNLKYLKWSYESIRKNLGYRHEICMADDFSDDGTWEWMKAISKKDQNVKIQHKQCRQSNNTSNNVRKSRTCNANQAIIDNNTQKELKAQTARWVRGRLEVLQYTLQMHHCFLSLLECLSPRFPTLYHVLGSRGQSRFQGRTKSIPTWQGLIPQRQI